MQWGVGEFWKTFWKLLLGVNFIILNSQYRWIFSLVLFGYAGSPLRKCCFSTEMTKRHILNAHFTCVNLVSKCRVLVILRCPSWLKIKIATKVGLFAWSTCSSMLASPKSTSVISLVNLWVQDITIFSCLMAHLSFHILWDCNCFWVAYLVVCIYCNLLLIRSGFVLVLQSSSTVVGRGYEFQLWGAGYYTVVHFPAQDLTVLWDRKTTVHIRAGPQWKVRGCFLWMSSTMLHFMNHISYYKRFWLCF